MLMQPLTLACFLSIQPASSSGMWQVYEKLKMNVSSAKFLQKLNSLSLNPCGTSSASTLVETEGEKSWPLFPI